MNQMTASKSTYLRPLSGLTSLVLAVLLTGVSCSKESESIIPTNLIEQDNLSTSIPYEEGTLEMPLSATMDVDLSNEEEALRSVNATIDYKLNGSRRHSITLPNELDVVCIIRSSGSDQPTYFPTKAIKRGESHIVQQERIRLRAGSTLAKGKRWYLMIVMGGSFNSSNGEFSYGSSEEDTTVDGSQTITNGGRVMDFPAASHWVEIPTDANGQPKWPKDWSSQEKNRKLTLFPQGVLCRATLRLDDSYKSEVGNTSVTLSVNRLRLVSTALSFAGKFSVRLADLPAIDFKNGNITARGGNNNGNLLKWIPTQAQATSKEYPHLDANTPEYVKVFSAPAGRNVLSVSGNSSSAIYEGNALPSTAQGKTLPSGVQAILFWAIPTSTPTNQLRTTLIAESGSSNSTKILAPQRTFIYGKRHDHQAASGRSVYFDAIYYHPYTPLDYMAERNLVRNTPNQFRVGGMYPNAISNNFATDHGITASALVSRSASTSVSIYSTDGGRTRSQSGGRHYLTPTLAQFESVLPVSNEHFNFYSAHQEVREDNQPVQVSMGGVTSNTTFSFRKPANGQVVYALSMAGFGGSNKHRVAYRYSYEENPDARATPQHPRVLSGIYLLMLHTDNARFTQDSRQATDKQGVPPYNRSTKYLKIEAIHLGASFLGTIDDIAREAFWTNAQYRKEVRYLSDNYTPLRRFDSRSSKSLRNWTNTLTTTCYRVRPTGQSQDNLIIVANSGGGIRLTNLSYDSEGKPIRRNEVNEMAWVAFSVRPFTTDKHP